ncbi:hypothetical protein SUDANB19_02268 [Streptomyces sp. enrichment culture]
MCRRVMSHRTMDSRTMCRRVMSHRTMDSRTMSRRIAGGRSLGGPPVRCRVRLVRVRCGPQGHGCRPARSRSTPRSQWKESLGVRSRVV